MTETERIVGRKNTARKNDRPGMGLCSSRASPRAHTMRRGVVMTVNSAVFPIVFQKKVNWGVPGVSRRV